MVSERGKRRENPDERRGYANKSERLVGNTGDGELPASCESVCRFDKQDGEGRNDQDNGDGYENLNHPEPLSSMQP